LKIFIDIVLIIIKVYIEDETRNGDFSQRDLILFKGSLPNYLQIHLFLF
jgi:hypothetical protein